MKKILITGGTGYIGSHTVVELIQNNYQVFIVDNLSNSENSVLDGIEKITGIKPEFKQIDLRHKTSVDDVFMKHFFDGVIHFAASKAVGESIEKPLLYYENNLGSLINVLEIMRKYKVRNFVFSSSATVYGEPDKLPVTEKSPRKIAESPYGNTKIIGEDILKDTLRAHSQINGISLRYFNPVGAHPSAQIGELPIGVPANLVPFLTQSVAGVRGYLQVFGDDYKTPDGTCIRDYINVVDLAKSHVVAMERLLTGKNKHNYEVFNVGTGKGNSVLEIIHAFEKATGKKVDYQIAKRRQGDVPVVYADTTLANRELGWKAKTSLEKTLLSAWKWEMNLREKNN